MLVKLRDKQVLRAELIGYKPILEPESDRISRGLCRAVRYTGFVVDGLSDYRGSPVVFNPANEVAELLKIYPLTPCNKREIDGKIIVSLEAVPLMFKEVSGKEPERSYPEIEICVPDETQGDMERLLKFLRHIVPDIKVADVVNLSLEITLAARYWERADRKYLAIENPETLIIKPTKRFFID